MSGLGKLLALQKQAQGVKNASPNNSAEPVRTDATPEPSSGGDAGEAGTGEISREATPTQVAPAAGVVPVRAAGGLQLNTLGNIRKPVARVDGGNQDSVPAIPASEPALPGNHGGPVDEPVFDLADIAGFDETVAPAIRRTEYGSGFDDEIEATAPDRELDPELTSQQLLFVESLDNIYQVLNDPDLFSQSVRMIMMELQENPEYIKLIADQDVHTMIRAMRNTMGLARIKKQEKTRKAKGTTAAKKRGAIGADAMALLDALGGDEDD